MKKGLDGDNVGLSMQPAPRRPRRCCTLDWTCHASGLMFTCSERTAAPALALAVAPDADALRGLVRRVASEAEPVRATVEGMTGARFIHDQLELADWEVLIADAQRV